MGLLRRGREKDCSGPESKEWPDHVTQLDEESFDSFLGAYPAVMVDFWAPWCAPCRKMTPRVRALAKKYRGRVAFGKVDTGRHPELARRFHVSSVPTFAFFRCAKKEWSSSGAQSLSELEKRLRDIAPEG